DVAGVPAGLRVKGELSGPGLTAPRTLECAPGELLLVPAADLGIAGNYVIDNLRLEDTQGNFILPAEPAVAAINVIERVIISQVKSRPLSLEEIRERGIVIDEDNYTAVEFTFGIETSSGQV